MKSEEVVEFDVQPWGVDENLVALLGEQGAAEFRALFDAFPDPVGVLWAVRDETGAIVDFAFGYGNLAMLDEADPELLTRVSPLLRAYMRRLEAAAPRRSEA